MALIIRDDNGKEEILDGEGRKSIWASIEAGIFICIVFVFLLFLIAFGFNTLPWLLSLLILLVCCLLFSLFSDEIIIFDKKIKSVIKEKRRIIDKKIKWKEIEKIKFSDIKEVYVIKKVIEDESHQYSRYQIKCILTNGNSLEVRIQESWFLFCWGRSNIVEEWGIRLCETIGVYGYFIDGENNKTILYEPNFEPNPKHEPVPKS